MGLGEMGWSGVGAWMLYSGFRGLDVWNSSDGGGVWPTAFRIAVAVAVAVAGIGAVAVGWFFLGRKS